MAGSYIRWFEDIGADDVASVGGKNASLGEMVRNLGRYDIKVPPGFAITADGYRHFLSANNLKPLIASRLAELKGGKASIAEVGSTLRAAVLKAEWPEDLAVAICQAYRDLSQRLGSGEADVAVRSSATAEDLPDASFAGQQETFLNVRSETLLDACRRCFASLFTDRATSYREAKGFNHLKVALSIGVQQMVRSDLAGAGVMFSIDTETGFDRVVLINAAWGLGENVVQGTIDPDEYQVFKPLLADAALKPIVHKRCGGKALKMIYAQEGESTRNIPTSLIERSAYVLADAEILQLARSACAIEDHYGRPMDIEWAKDGRSGELFVVQARPETVHSHRRPSLQRTYKITRKGRKLVSGLSVGGDVVSGPVCIIRDPKNIDRFVPGSVLVTDTTNPDWIPIMRRATAIVTDRGGRTSHAAIVSRELGVPAIVGTGDGTKILQQEHYVTVSCAEGDEGFVYEGIAEVVTEEMDVTAVPRTRTKIMLNLANPAAAFRWWRLPADGVGLARMEFVIANQVKVHPMALVHFEELTDEKAAIAIAELTRGYQFQNRLFRRSALARARAHRRDVLSEASDREVE